MQVATSATVPSKRFFTNSSSASVGLSQWLFSAKPKEAIGRKPLSAYAAFVEHLAEVGKQLPGYVHRDFEAYLQCRRLEHGFLRLRCDTCHAEHLVAFSCKCRGFCPSCGARRMVDGAAWLVDQVLPQRPIRQWVLSFLFPLRFLFATNPALISRVLGIAYRVNATGATGSHHRPPGGMIPGARGAAGARHRTA